MIIKEGFRPQPAYLQEGFRAFVATRREQRAKIVARAIEAWGTSRPGETPTIRKVAKSVGLTRDAVSIALNDLLKTDPDFPDPRKKIIASQLKIDQASIGNVTRGLAYNHPEKFASLGTVIGRSGVQISNRKARVELEQAGFRVRVIMQGHFRRYVVLARDEGAINSHLQYLLRKDSPKKKGFTLDNLSRGVAEHHRDIFATVGETLREAGLKVSSRRIREVVSILIAEGFRIKEISFEQRRRDAKRLTHKFYILREDLPRIKDFIWKNRSRLQVFSSPSTSRRRRA